jgi:Cys-tRNA(Pro)/Cys-tRNA(Cys) deacylase
MMDKLLTSPVTALLQREKIPYQVIEIPLSAEQKPVRQLEELLTGQGIDPQSIVRSVLFKTASDKFVLLAVAGGGRADWGVLRKHLNERKCRMADADEVTQATGYVVGAVPPVALPADIKILVDQSVSNYTNVVIGSGVLGFALLLKGSDLLKLVGSADQGRFTSAEPA